MTSRSAFFEACERGDIIAATNLVGQLDLSFKEIAAKLRDPGLNNKIKKTDDKGDTALHLAVKEGHLDMVKILVDLDASLCDCANKGGETPLKLAVSLGFKEAVEFFITRTSNALHYIVELNQVKLVQFLIDKNVALSELINLSYKPVTNKCDNEDHAANPPDKEDCATNPTNSPDNEGNCASNPRDVQPIEGEEQPIVVIEDTPLHIAARNKFEHMVNLLLKVPGVNKVARNSEGKTPFDIAREVTEYHESFRIIRKLGDFRRKPKAFMYCAPQVSHKKYKKARFMVNKAYEDRRNAELVVAALLAAMTCAAAFTVPGGFNSESPAKENQGTPVPSPSNVEDDQGTPLLISLVSFKLFIIFDCIAFFLSLFVCIMWEMSSELTTGDKMLFMTVNSLVVCCSFGFTAFGFMSAVYAMLARKVRTFSWVVLGSLIAITSCGVLAFIRQSLHFVVTRARFHRLCGVSCFVDDIVEKVWCGAERCGLLNLVRSGDDASRDFINGQVSISNSKCSPSCCCYHV